MAKIYVKLYDPFTISGLDFAPINSNAMRRIVFSPDGRSSISISQLPDGCLLLSNEGECPAFSFSISREQKVVAVVRFATYAGYGQSLCVNTNWLLYENGVKNIEIKTNPDLVRSTCLHIDIQVTDDIGRANLKIGKSGFAAMVFSKELYFMKMNGHHTVPRLLGYIDRIKRQSADEAAKTAKAEAEAAAEVAKEEAVAAALKIGRKSVLDNFFGAK